MSTISFSGLASGIDTSSWVEALVAVKQQEVTTLQTKQTTLNAKNSSISSLKSYYSTLSTQTQKILDAKLGLSSSIFAAKKVTSSGEDYLTAKVTSSAPITEMKVDVVQLATKTIAQGNYPVKLRKLATEDTKLGELDYFCSGLLHLESESGKVFEIYLTDDMTLKEVFDAINNTTDFQAVFYDNGDIKISTVSPEQDKMLDFANSTTNFLDCMALIVDETGIYSNKYLTYVQYFDDDVDLMDAKLVTNSFNDIHAGNFFINGQEFIIDENTTMRSLVSAINSNKEANATAMYNVKTGTFTISSKEGGDEFIDINSGTSDFVGLLGLLNHSGQTKGQNAIIKINGETIESTSNSLSSKDLGISGLSFELKKVTKPGESILVTIGNDNDSLLSSISNFLSAYNEAVGQTNSLTQSGQNLAFDNTLMNSRNDMRRLMSSTIVDSGFYKTLGSIGISTGAPGLSVDDDTSKLVLDEDKFLEAYEKDPQAVEDLLVAMAEKLEKQTQVLIKAQDGYFSAKTNSINSQLSSLETQIARKQESVSLYQTQLEAKFRYMEQVISNLRSQYSNLSSLGITSS